MLISSLVLDNFQSVSSSSIFEKSPALIIPFKFHNVVYFHYLSYMGRHALLSIKESSEKLQLLKKVHKGNYQQIRLQALLLLQDKVFQKRSEVALAIGKSTRTLERWMKAYRKFGIDSLLKNVSGGTRRSCMSKEAHKKLEEKLNDSRNPLLGYWDAVNWFNKNTSEVISYHTLRNYMITNFKTKLKSPRKSHYKKDEQAIVAFKKTT